MLNRISFNQKIKALLVAKGVAVSLFERNAIRLTRQGPVLAEARETELGGVVGLVLYRLWEYISEHSIDYVDIEYVDLVRFSLEKCTSFAELEYMLREAGSSPQAIKNLRKKYEQLATEVAMNLLSDESARTAKLYKAYVVLIKQ